MERGRGQKQVSKSIVMGLDGACPDIISGKVAAGKMPNFARLFKMGCKCENAPYPSASSRRAGRSLASFECGSSSSPSRPGSSNFCAAGSTRKRAGASSSIHPPGQVSSYRSTTKEAPRESPWWSRGPAWRTPTQAPPATGPQARLGDPCGRRRGHTGDRHSGGSLPLRPERQGDRHRLR